MKKKAITKIASIITFVLIAFVLTVILLIESNGGVSADSTKNKITVSKSSTVSIYVTGVGVDLVSSDSFQDVYSVEQATTVTIQAVNETHIFNEWAIENGEGIVNPNNLLSNDALDDSKTTFTMPSEDLTIKFTRSDPSQADYGKYMNNRFVIDSVEEFISLQTILSNYRDVVATETTLIEHYDELFGNAEDYKTLTNEEKVRYINATADSKGNKLATEKAYARLASGYFLVANNISVFTKDFKGIGTSTVPFNGVMCGLSSGESSQVVLVFSDKDNSTAHYGLFNYLGNNAVIRNLRVRTSIGVTDSGTNDIYAGGLAAEAGNALLVNTDVVSNINIECTDSADVYAGGFIGKATNTSIDDISDIKSNRDNGAVIIETKGTAYSGYFAGYAVDSYVKELNLNISGLSMSTRNTGTSNGKNIYSGLVFGYLTNTKEIVLKDIKLTSTINFKVDNYIKNNTCYTGGVAGYLNDTKTVNLGSISLENKSLTESIIRSNTQDGSSTANVFTGGLFGSIANKNVKSLNKFKNRISTISVDDKVAYLYDPVFTGNIGIEAIQNGRANGTTYGKCVAGGIVAKGYIDINGTGGNTYKDGETHLVLSKTGTLNIKATQSSLSQHDSFENQTQTVNNVRYNITNGTSDNEHLISSMFVGIVKNGSDEEEYKNINIYGEQVNSIATREIGSKSMGHIYNSCFISYANGSTFNNINLYLNNSLLKTDSLSYEVMVNQTTDKNNAFTGALSGYIVDAGVVESISVQGVIWDNLDIEEGTKLKINAIQNTLPNANNQNYQGENYVGGIIGQLYTSSATKLRYIGSNTEEDYIRMGGHENPDSAFCGGLIGFIKSETSYPNNEINITDSIIKNATILGEATNANTNLNNPDIFVGGILGAIYYHDGGTGNLITLDNLSVIGCDIKSVGNEYLKTYAGGIFGIITWGNNRNHQITNCFVLNSNITANVFKTLSFSKDYNAYASGIGNRELTGCSITYKNDAVVDTTINSTHNAGGITATISDGTCSNCYSNAILNASTMYGISGSTSNNNTNYYYKESGKTYSGGGVGLSFNKTLVTSKSGDTIFDNTNDGTLSNAARGLDYLFYVMSYNNGYKSNAEISGTNSVSYTITDANDTKYYEDVVNVWVNFKGQGRAYPLDLSKSKEELASDGWFNMGEKIVYNKTGSLVTNTEITDIEFLYGYDYNEHSESRKNFSGAKEYVLTTTANTGNTSSTYTFGINVHETISYLKIKFYAPQTSEYFTSFTNTFAAYGTYEFSSKLVDVVETVDGVETTVKKKLYEFILYPNFELTKDGTTTLQFVEKGGVINLNKFVFNFNKNDLQLVGVTYADYTPPLNYYEIDNKTATEYDLYADSITKFVPVVIKLNDLVRTEYVDEKYIELVSYTSSVGTIKASGELTVTNATTDEKVTLTPKTGLSGNKQEVTFNVYEKYDVTYSVIGMTPDCIPFASNKTDYYFPIYVDNGYVATPETATIKIGTGKDQNIASLTGAKLLDEEGNEVTFSDEQSYYLLKIDKDLIKGTIHIKIEFPLVYQIKFDLQCATFNPNVTEMTRTYILRNTTTVYDYFGYGEKAYAPYITKEAYDRLTNKTGYTEFTDPVTKDTYYYLSDVNTHITPEEYEAKPSDEKSSYILFNQKIKYTELYNWIRSNTTFGYIFTGFYMVDNANTAVSYGEKFEDILEDKITLNTSLIFYARWSFLIELVEAPGTTIESSFSETFMYEINDSTLVNKTVKVPINNNRGFIFSIIKDENYLGEAGVKAYIVTKNHSNDQVLTEIYVEKYHENMYLYFIPPEQITGYLMLVTSISNSGFIVGEHTATVTEEILPEDGVMTFKYVANHRNTTDEVSYIYNSGDPTNPGSNLLLNKDFVIKFYQQVYNSSTHLTEREVRYLPEGSVVEVYYQKVVNNSIVKRIVGIKKIPADDDPSTTHSDVSELLLSSFITIDQEENSFAFPQNETYGSFLGSNQYVSEVYYFVITPPNGFKGHAQDQILNFEIEGGYVDNNRASGYVEGVRTTHDFINKPLVDNHEVQIEKSNQNKVYSITPSRETQLTIGADGTYEFEDHKHYEIFRIDTQYAGIDDKKLVIYDGVGKNTIIQSQKLPFKLLELNLELGYGTGNINVYGGRDVDGIVEWYIIDTINVSEIQYNDYKVSFEGYEITNSDNSKTAIKFDYFKLDNISGNEIKLQSMAVYSLETAMTYEINEFEFEAGTEQIAFEGDVINDIRHDGKTFMLAIQLKKDGKIVENIPTTLTITVSGIDDPVNPFIDNGDNGRVTAYFNLSDCLKTLGGDIIDFTISIPSGYELYAVQLLEAENANKPALSEVRATIYHSPLNN